METIKKFLRVRKLGVVATALLMSLPLAFLAWICYILHDATTVFNRVFSGQLFSEQWDATSPEFVSPEPGRGYLAFAMIAVIVFPYVTLVRTICARKTRSEYWTFFIPTALVCLFLVCIDTLPVCLSIKWINAAGGTPARIDSLLLGLAGYIAVLGFFLWAIWPPKHNEEPGKQSILDTPL